MDLTHLRNGQSFFPQPTVVERIIDSRCPLHKIQRSTLKKEHFEIVAIIEGALDFTVFSCHFRISHLSKELFWGYQFSSCDSTLSGFGYQKFKYVQLIDARPFWNYDEEEINDPTIPGTPTSSPDFAYKRRFNSSRRNAKIQRQNATDDIYHKKHNILSPFVSHDTFRKIITIESTGVGE